MAAVLGIAIALCVPGFSGLAHAIECGNGGLIVVPGTNDRSGASMANVKKNPQYSGYTETVVDYPTTLWPMGTVGYNEDVAKGKAATAQAIGSYQKNCPGKPIAVVGYSQGARVAGDVLSDIGNKRNNTVTVDGVEYEIESSTTDPSDESAPPGGISGVLYSDPRQDGTVEGRGIEQSMIGLLPGLVMTGKRDGGFGDLAGGVVSVCDRGDAICDLPDPLHDPLGAIDGLIGYFTKHGLYPAIMAVSTASGANGRDIESWTGSGSCRDAGSGGTICTRGDDSAFVGLLKDVAVKLGVSDPDVIPDFVAWRPRVPASILPHVGLNDLQPVFRFVADRLPQLPNLTYHAGGYLPDALAIADIAQGILTLNGPQFTQGVKAVGKSLVSIVMIPVVGAHYWTGRLMELVGPTTPADPSSARSAVSRTAATPGTARARLALTRVLKAASASQEGRTSASRGGGSDGAPHDGGSAVNHKTAEQKTTDQKMTDQKTADPQTSGEPGAPSSSPAPATGRPHSPDPDGGTDLPFHQSWDQPKSGTAGGADSPSVPNSPNSPHATPGTKSSTGGRQSESAPAPANSDGSDGGGDGADSSGADGDASPSTGPAGATGASRHTGDQGSNRNPGTAG